jgi:hypothetical protein
MRTPYDMVQVNHGESPNPRKAENWWGLNQMIVIDVP